MVPVLAALALPSKGLDRCQPDAILLVCAAGYTWTLRPASLGAVSSTPSPLGDIGLYRSVRLATRRRFSISPITAAPVVLRAMFSCACACNVSVCQPNVAFLGLYTTDTAFPGVNPGGAARYATFVPVALYARRICAYAGRFPQFASSPPRFGDTRARM